MILFAQIVSVITGFLAAMVFATGMSSCLTGNWFWIDALNKSMPAVLQFSNPTSVDFWGSISTRPWSDPMPMILVTCFLLALIGYQAQSYVFETKLFEMTASLQRSLLIYR